MPGPDYEEVFEQAEVGIALNDPEDGTVGLVNQRYAELMGYSRDTLESMPIGEISANDPAFDQSAALERIQQALEGEPQRFDWLFERADGSRFWGEVVLKRTTAGDGDRLLAFVRDISDRKEYERKLEQQNRRLEEFASVVSHDLRNPLNIASGRVELAMDECDSDHLEEVERAHDRMERLIRDLLALARAGDSIGETEAVDLDAAVSSCWGNVKTRNASLSVETDEAVVADSNRLQQLIENLLRNRVEHGGPEVTVTVGGLETGFYVADDGDGIPAGERDRIFEPGYTASPAGTGFGLSIVRDIAEAHGWSVSVEESEHGGARLEFTGVEAP